MTVRVTVLYEDQACDGAVPRFGPHEFLLALVADLTSAPIDALRREVEAHPAKGAAKLVAKCADEVGENIAADCHPVIALFDRDRIREARSRACLPQGIPARATDSRIIRMLEGLCRHPGKLRVALLDRNVETLLKAVRDLWKDDSSVRADQYDAAIRHKSRNDRDVILGRLARSAGAAQIREKVMNRVPGLQNLRDVLIAALQLPPSTGGKR